MNRTTWNIAQHYAAVPNISVTEVITEPEWTRTGVKYRT